MESIVIIPHEGMVYGINMYAKEHGISFGKAAYSIGTYHVNDILRIENQKSRS